MNKNKFLKTNEAAEYIGVSRSSLTNWVKQGLLGGATTTGGHYRFSYSELDEFAKKRGLTTRNRQSDDFRILLIEDDEQFREFIKDALDVFNGYELRETVDGMQGALMVGTWKPDLIILDLRMPNMNGMDFLRMLRKDDKISDVKIIVASAYLTEEIKKDLNDMNVEIVLEKPVRLAKLIASIQQMANLELS